MQPLNRLALSAHSKSDPSMPSSQPGREPQVRTVHLPGFVFRLGEHPAGASLPRHHHDDPTVCCVYRGGFTEYVAGEAAECPPGTLKLMPAGETHWNRFGTRDTRGLRIDVDRERFAEVPAIRRALDERRHITGARGAELARRMMVELTAGDTAGPVAAEGLALELLAELARVETPRPESSGPAWLDRAEALVRERFRTGISLGEIAREVGVAPTVLARAYRRRAGCTIGERIRRLRVEQAARELAETEEPLSEIALRAGFYDQSHFSNVFRRIVGLSPAAYRAAVR